VNLVIFLALLAFVVTRILKSVRSSKQDFWQSMARRLEPDGDMRRVRRAQQPLFEGVVDGFPALVERIPNPVSAGAQETRYTLSYPPLGLGLHVRLQNPRDDDDIQVGDPSFDRTHCVYGESAARVRAFLTAPRRARIQRVLAAHPGTRVTDAAIILVLPSSFPSEHEINAVLRDFAQLARELQHEPDADELAGTAVEERRAADPSPALLVGAALRAGEPEPDEPPERAPRLEGDELVVPAAELSPRLDRPTAEAEPEPEPEPGPDPDPEPVVPASSTLDAASVCERLFGESRPSYDTAALFDDEYAGQRVRWRGVLRSSSKYFSDMDFGDGPGVKATIDLGALEGYGGGAASLVVALEPELEEELRAARGAAITVAGTLARCDAFMRVLYLTGGSYELA
jgi:hypothetical protein